MWATAGRFRPIDDAERLQGCHDIWKLLRPEMVTWLSARSPQAHFRIQFGQDISFEFTLDAKATGRSASMNIAVRFTPEDDAAYAKRRMRQPLFEPLPPSSDDPHQTAITVRALLLTALEKSRLAASLRYSRLPAPVRYRISGALSAWSELHDMLVVGSTTQTLGTVLRTEPLTQAIRFTASLTRQILPNGTSGESIHALAGDAAQSTVWQIMELCDGVFYEPSSALHRLLHSAYIADDVPIGSLVLPCDTLCIVPEASSWERQDGNEAIVLAKRRGALSCACWTRGLDEAGDQVTLSTLELPLADPGKTISQLLDEVLTGGRADTDGPLTSVGRSDAVHQHWRITLDYALKMLLYLSVRDAHVIPNRAYSDAPRNFAGLGKRKRAERMAEIEQLYDRYVIGPALLDEEVATSMPSEDISREVRSHWRRPYFKMQPYGPNATLRKLAFIGPTIVRADRLSL
ncbi:hypothetical protein [Pseudomonas chlororaphis]|uniref:hypothetical protein n=1 Tax=Pseudomonas chlororaphis TaxID=587753 RepID=UPI000F58A3F2|nr:hypothetical protein [Pseudomonas chlororaphis]